MRPESSRIYRGTSQLQGTEQPQHKHRRLSWIQTVARDSQGPWSQPSLSRPWHQLCSLLSSLAHDSQCPAVLQHPPAPQHPLPFCKSIRAWGSLWRDPRDPRSHIAELQVNLCHGWEHQQRSLCSHTALGIRRSPSLISGCQFVSLGLWWGGISCSN